MAKRKISGEEKLAAVKLYLEGKESQRRLAKIYNVSLASAQHDICKKYQIRSKGKL